MPIQSSNSNCQYWMVSLKMVLISTGVLSTGAFLKLSVPVAAHFFLSELPSIWASLTPPYLYLLLNCIIITILASSRLHHPNLGPSVPDAPAPPPISSSHFFNAYTYHTPRLPDLQIHESIGHPLPKMLPEVDNEGDSNDSLIFMKSPMSNHNDNDKPPLSSRIRQRKLVKSSPEGKPLGVSKPKRQETLESTWRTITEGRSMPLTRHLRKSDTWDSPGRRPSPPATPPQSKVMRKSETFSGGGSPSPSPGGAGRVKREASLSHDELNRRVEAFIKKFNDEMRLQRQESFKQYQEMMSH